MEAWEKIEIIVKEVGDYYNIQWQRLWKKNVPGYTKERATLFRLANDFLHPVKGHEYIGFSGYGVYHRLRNTPPDEHYRLLKTKLTFLLTEPLKHQLKAS